MTRTAPLRTPLRDSVEAPAPEHTEGTRGRLLEAVRRPWLRDVVIIAAFVGFAFWLVHDLLADPHGRALGQNPTDQALYEWFLAYDTHLWTGDFSLVTDRLNAPDGVNLLANTTVIALGAVLAPITLIFGAPVTFALLVPINLAGTAIAWYLLFSRTMRAGRFASTVGAALCGFAPGMISQSNAHLHITAQWLVPAMVWAVVRMWRAAQAGERNRAVGSGLILAVLVSLQVLIGEETLFLTALTLFVITLVYAVMRRPSRADLGRFLAGLGVATGVAAALLAGPLLTQFAGRQSVPDGPFSPDYFYADLASFGAFSPLSIAGSPDSLRLSTGYTELNTFLGWPLLIVTVVAVVWLRRQAIAVACAVAALIMCALSLGPQIVIDRERTGIPGLYRIIHGLPIVDGALPMRFALAAVPLIAVLLVLLIEEVRTRPTRALRYGVPVLVVASLAPLLPSPLPTAERPAVPRFYSEGHWRECAPEGGVIVPVPIATPPAPEPMRYAVATDVAFGMPEGFFIGPYGRSRRASIGTYKRPTSLLIADVAKTGRARDVNDTDRALARRDLAYWKADCVVLTATVHEDALLLTMNRLLGPGEHIADATVWRVKR
ncbi:hypothetical protein AB0H43_07415 [Hamadaea sp. NPDC050747]|uniref:hypothetical protein n=1 Tax=Hamadaea sp. NPDC050747 TaxID=3155789 RepID=UPI0033F720C0